MACLMYCNVPPGPRFGFLRTIGRRAIGTRNDTQVEFKVELKEPGTKPFSLVPFGIGTFKLERSTLVSPTRLRCRKHSDLPQASANER